MRALKRVTTETVAVEPFSGLDGQGAPSYGASQNIEARVVREDEQVIDADGDEIRTTLTLWVDADESPLPAEQDRVTVDGTVYIGVSRYEGKSFRADVTHVRLRCREQ